MRRLLPLLFLMGCKDLSSEDSGSNTPPSLSAVALEPAEIYEDTTVTCVPSGWLDEDGDPEQYIFRWKVNGAEVSNDAILDGASFSKGDAVICEVTPTDGESDGAPVASAESAVLNSPPELPSAVITPEPPNRGATVSVALPNASDADGDVLEVEVTWYVNGANVSVLDQLSPTLFARGDTLYAVVSVTDGEAEPQTLVTPSTVAGNAPPVIHSATLSPDPARSSDTLSVTVDAEDPDGDAFTLSYAWFIDGQQIAASGDTLDGAQWLYRDAVVTVAVSGDDGAGVGAELISDPITIANSPPPAPTVDATPERPGAGLMDLVCEPVASEDADGDAVSLSVRWEVDGVAFTDTTTTTLAGDTVPAEFLEEGQEWTCYASGWDGAESGDEGSWSATIGQAWSDLELDGRTMTLSSGTHNYNRIILRNNATLYVSGETTLRAYSVEVEFGSTIDGDGGGYAGGSAAQDGRGSGGGGQGGSSTSTVAGGGGGGHGGVGGAGGYDTNETPGAGGTLVGDENSVTIERGSGGGGGGVSGGDGGDGGAALAISAELVMIEGAILLNGTDGTASNFFNGGGGGAGGGLMIQAEEIDLGAACAILVMGGSGGDGNTTNADGGGGGGGGRIKLFYERSINVPGSAFIFLNGGPAGSGGTNAAQDGTDGVYHDLEVEYTP